MTIAALRALIDSQTPDTPHLPAPRTTPSKGGPTVDTRSAAHAVAMYRNGDTVSTIVKATGLTQDQIAAAVTSAGTVFTVNGTTPVATGPGAAAAGLIAWGMKHPSARMQRLAEQARTALADLQQAQRQEAAITAAADRVQRLKDQLAAAEQDLRAAKGTATTSRPSSTAPRPDRTQGSRIRAWARENNLPVGTAGVISRDVITAYAAAHPQECTDAA
ncbi:hypothetical protein C7C46_08830 [Streptomyces tateyamensis]|uniref:Lsr2 DNA-binding domain-containing protein n=1 Tax=Streptomyces tateyamensis TaxID=565073 RepID=A0A2V4NE61_9ACTN|nr:histone-like nucleoid-structuring protein Lsr2 [Streptomyces tateyamensis]PYC83429.1 hypothetical protein C7C46_08830 [Streptomyces tateyamensis]